MQCMRCQAQMTADDSYEHAGETLCENCYMDVLNPTKTCDPWAVFTAKHAPSHDPSSPAQHKIMAILEKSGPITPDDLLAESGLSPNELEREIATLWHMAKLRGVLRDDGSKVFMLFNQ